MNWQPNPAEITAASSICKMAQNFHHCALVHQWLHNCGHFSHILLVGHYSNCWVHLNKLKWLQHPIILWEYRHKHNWSLTRCIWLYWFGVQIILSKPNSPICNPKIKRTDCIHLRQTEGLSWRWSYPKCPVESQGGDYRLEGLPPKMQLCKYLRADKKD